MNYSNEEIFSNNFRALKLVSECAFHAAQDILLKTLHFFPESEAPEIEEVMTLNNLAYIQLKLGNSKDSLEFLSRAARFIPNSPFEIQYSIGTLMNLCYANSALGFHQIALQQAYRALEISEDIDNNELIAVIHYNIASQLAILERTDKAGYFFQETINLSNKNFGSKHKLSILAQKASVLCTTPGKYHYRVKSSGSNSKNSSFSINSSKIGRYTIQTNDYTEKLAENRVKINFSTKVASIITANRPIHFKNRLIGMPYIKEIRRSKRIDAAMFNTPKPVKKKTESLIIERNKMLTASEKIGKKYNLRKRLKTIREQITSLEDKLKDFTGKSRDMMKFIDIEVYKKSPLKIKAIVTIQEWFRKFLHNKYR
ncbi:hypothetical protein SteCoe_26045 [Stentor coeruleus]|uniref:Uncharacterized protein n=1 Tax=Stentor coeruleus TaxID=5963 RepID=A0A1R2BDT9_9CILI|nr:hypothetical protein SteCoe_26045 [Stentor coeruleus]